MGIKKDEQIEAYIEQHKTTACRLYPHAEVIPIRKVYAALNRIKNNADLTLSSEPIERMKIAYEDACNAYLKAFCDKHNLEYLGDEAWVAGRHGEVASANDYFIDFRDIRTDIDLNAPEHCFLHWYDLSVEATSKNEPYINYETFLKAYVQP